VLAETGRREKRSRLLPAHVVVYFVMAMAIFRGNWSGSFATPVEPCLCGAFGPAE
jgi:Insertion element 4 transposase N-terminal